MNEPAAAHIDAHMRVSAALRIEKHQIAYQQPFLTHPSTCPAHGARGARQLNAGGRSPGIVREAAAVKAGARRVSAPLIGFAKHADGSQRNFIARLTGRLTAG